MAEEPDLLPPAARGRPDRQPRPAHRRGSRPVPLADPQPVARPPDQHRASHLLLVHPLGAVGTAPLSLGALGEVTIPGYMFWAVIIYTIGGTWLAIRIG